MEEITTLQIWGKLSIKNTELLDYNTLNLKNKTKFIVKITTQKRTEGRKLFFTDECQLINVEGMIK